MLFRCKECHSEHSKFNFEGNQIVSEVIFRRAYWKIIFEKGVNCELIIFSKFSPKNWPDLPGEVSESVFENAFRMFKGTFSEKQFWKNCRFMYITIEIERKKNEFLSKAILRGTKPASHISRRTLLVNFFKNFLWYFIGFGSVWEKTFRFSSHEFWSFFETAFLVTQESIGRKF